MPGKIDARLKELGIALPALAAPVANYVATTRHGDTLYVAGQITLKDGKVEYVGKLGREIGLAEGRLAARLCALNVLAQVRNALDGDLDRVVRCLRLGGFVNATPDFADHPKVLNGASDLIVEVLGDAGRHARAAVGVGSLPFGVAVEVEATFAVR